MKNSILLILIFAAILGAYAYQKANPSEPEHIGSSKITSEQAVENVKKLPEVKDYLKEVPNGKVEMDNEDEGKYNVHVYEVKNGHTATFNWYRVSIKDGKVEEQFSTKGVVSGKICYPSEVLPKGTIEAKRISDGKIFILNHGGSEDEKGVNYKFKLEEGDYYLRFKTKGNIIGYSTTVCPTGKEETCADKKPRVERKAEIKVGETISNYDLCDYFYQDTNAPKF